MEELSKNKEEIEEIEEIGSLTKTKKPRTDKQIDAFKEAMRKRAENIEIRKNEKLVKASEILVNNSKKDITPKNKEFMKQVKKPIYQSESESEEEIIIVKAKPKKKVKKIIIEDSSSSDDGSYGGRGNRNKYQQPEQVTIQRNIPEPSFNARDFFI
jgi:hypothetical protein